MRRIIVFLFFASPFLALAQTNGPLNKNSIGKMMDWVSIFTLYSDVELSGKVDLQQYSEAADLATAIMTNPELSVKIAEIREATFVNIYPKGILQSNEWVITKLNDVSNAQYDVLNAPYVTLDIVFTPVTNGYIVVLTAQGSSQIAQSLAAVNSEMNSSISGVVFPKPRESKTKVNEAIFEGLDKLKTILGAAYEPKIAIRYDDKLYLNNQTIETWQRTGEAISLTAVNKSNAPLAGNITWTNATGNSAVATVPIDVKGTKQVTVRAGADQISVNVNVKEFEVNVEEILKEILIQVINDHVTRAREKIDSIKNASGSVDKQIVSTKQELDIRAGMTASVQNFPGMVVEEEDVIDERKGTSEELISLKQDERSNAYIELHRRRFILVAEVLLQIKIETLLADIIRNEGSIQAYITAIKEKSPEVFADLILNLIKKPENREKIKNIIVDYLNEQINEVASKL